MSASLVRLSKLGLIELMLDRTAGEDNYDLLKADKYLTEILERYQKANPNLELEIGAMKSLVYVNEYGMQFKKACK